MRKQRQTIKSREALFSIWYLPCEEDRRSALPEAFAPSLRCSRRLETCLSFLAMPTLSRYTEVTQPRVAESPGGTVGDTEPSVGRVRSGSTCGSHFSCSQKCVDFKHLPQMLHYRGETLHVFKAGRKVTFRIKQSFGFFTTPELI